MKIGSTPGNSLLFLIAAGVAASPAAAQEDVLVSQEISTYAPHFFIAILGGVILAIGFQILLTSLSVASGISLVGNVEKKADKRAHERDERRSREREREPREERRHAQAFVRSQEPRGEEERPQKAEVVDREEDEDEEETSPVVKLSNAIGVWTVITASISLFFASLLAVRLSLVGSVWTGITLGLIIWAAFFATMTYLEIRSASTLIGGVFSAALSGLRGSFTAAKNVFGSSTEEKIAKIGTETASALREELSGTFDASSITAKVDEYVERLRPQPIDFEQIKADLTNILRNVQLEEHTDVTEGHLDRQTFVRLVEDQPHIKKEDATKLKNMYDDISSSVKEKPSGHEKAEAVVDKLAPGSEEDVARYRAKVEAYLRETGREELDPDQIKEDIDKIFEDPKSTREVLLNRLNAMDRSTLVTMLAQRNDMGEEKAEQLVGKVESALHFVREKIMGMSGQAKEQAEGAKANAGGAASQMKGIPGKVEDRVRRYMSSIGRPEFDYDRIRLDFERMLHDPKASFKILRARMKLYDRDSLVALLSSRRNISPEDAEHMVDRIEEARDNVLHRAEAVENEVRRRITQAKQTALHEAESVRKASAAAAWWMVGTAVVSGAFSALGAALAITW